MRTAELEEHFAGHRRPKVPNDLIWFHHEPTWQALADRRIRYKTEKLSATLTYEDDFNIDAGVKGLIEGFGLKLGGEFRDFQATKWEFQAIF